MTAAPPSRWLIIAGIDNSDPDHWQTAWERDRADCYRVELGCWDDPIRNVWISRLDQAIYNATSDVVLVAHSLGCHAVAWWARQLGPTGRATVRGALLVAPPDVDLPNVDPRLARFAPTPEVILPFPAAVVASRDDHYAPIERSREMADLWGAAFIDAGELGHINARSGLGSWLPGQRLATLVADGKLGRRRLDLTPRMPVAPAKALCATRSSPPQARGSS